METIRFTREQADQLAGFLTGEQWPFHSTVVQRPRVLRQVAEGHWDGPSARTFWLREAGNPVGVVRLFDLDDGTPLFDLRVAGAWRGRGIGSAAVRWLTRYLFTELPEINRIEATTRHDNHAMRAVLRRNGYVKEAHYRQAWPDQHGAPHDGVGYAVLRRDWLTGATTPVRWSDEGCGGTGSRPATSRQANWPGW
ncbi:GNAT family N-acetyltransferase [Goodfellowiella coeruleoviolacea]|uniref:Protein N-acetyltransferase, RimJ/RimL family n=1 Tax=Goodfellowiella coeruleoviolacea TaxID=334858 RepID=A0AAE3GHL8_9PSEU|nr:GNAT family protein [Goodfellowiella coeruleoviolacea]MCP2168377.1 Protein N-acetyltransferase, RimJ/RimL family [Goodfellowiella coeruleoviolacea]